ncbi:MAG: 4Fe-4S dicluster domain-containing protein [Veillonella parvula]
MMGIAQNDLSVPVVKATNSILCLMKDQNAAAQNPVCLRCGKCVSVCPMRLQPLYIYRFVKANRVDELERLNVNDCIECGCCSYTCPGKLSIAEQCRVGKKMLKEAGKK